MINKILQIQKKLSLTDAEFCRKIGYRPQNFNQWKNGASPIPMKAIVKMLQVFENINADWVLLDRGNMLKDEIHKHDNVLKEPISEYNTAKENMYSPLLKAKENEIAALKQTIEVQQKLIERLTK